MKRFLTYLTLIWGLMALNASILNGQSFVPDHLDGTIALSNPTSLCFGPDGKLYVTQQKGLIRVYSVTRSGAGDYSVTANDSINLIANIPNHDDDGTLNPLILGRQVTGILATGTAANPILYVSNSDPRGFSGDSTILDTNSGTITKLSWTGTAWEMVHVVRGLPRSGNGHSGNGLSLDSASNTLYHAMGGHTNMGAPSTQFASLPEYAFSAAILSFDLNTIEALPLQIDGGQSWHLDMPTLDDPDPSRNTAIFGEDLNDPFGGHYGNNQAKITLGFPVQVHATGFRNIFDVLYSSKNQLYTFDNGPNNGWGDIPVSAGPSGVCSNLFQDGGTTLADNFHLVSPGYYGGHPNPTRANSANTFAGQSPILSANPIECDYQTPGVTDPSLLIIPASTNGLAEYTSAAAFGGDMQGDILAASFDGSIYKIDMGLTGTTFSGQTALLSGFCSKPLDIVTMGDSDPYPGTIWVVCYGDEAVLVFEPQDSVVCTGDIGFVLDDDLDGYSNGDEISNGTDPCSAGSFPPDNDEDNLSDELDIDDDNDGQSDVIDLFVLDPVNGLGAFPPLNFEFGNTGADDGFFGMGFTGMMQNGIDYLNLFEAGNVTAGGAASVFTLDAISEGDAYGTGNDQEYAFHTGIDLSTSTGRVAISTKLLPPYFDGANAPQNFQAFGLYFGTGTQSDYVKLVLSNSAMGELGIVFEIADIPTQFKQFFPVPSGALILYLEINPSTNKVQAAWSLDNGISKVPFGNPFPIPPSWFDNVIAVGVLGTSTGAPPAFTATWDYLYIEDQALELACQDAPLNPGEITLGTGTAEIFWDAVPGARGYSLKGRAQGLPSFKTIISTSPSLTVNGLIPGEDYEWKVSADCYTELTPFTPLRPFTIP